MTLTQLQFDGLVSRYAEEVVDRMDLKTLEHFAYDTIVNESESMSQSDLLGEMSLYFNDEEISQLLIDVGADPDTIL